MRGLSSRNLIPIPISPFYDLTTAVDKKRNRKLGFYFRNQPTLPLLVLLKQTDGERLIPYYHFNQSNYFTFNPKLLFYSHRL